MIGYVNNSRKVISVNTLNKTIRMTAIADYWYITVTLSYKSLAHFSEVHTLLLACYTTAHPMPPQCTCFWWQWRFFTTPLSIFSAMFLALTNSDINAYNSRRAIFCPASWLLLSSRLYMASITTNYYPSYLNHNIHAIASKLHSTCNSYAYC